MGSLLGYASLAGSVSLPPCPPEAGALGLSGRPEVWVLVCVRGAGFCPGLLSAHLSVWPLYFVSDRLSDP